MRRLTTAKVFRGGRTARVMSHENNKVQLNLEKGKNIYFKFSLSSKGGGTTDVKLAIGVEDFEYMFKYMLLVDRESAMRTMASKLAQEIENQANYDKVTIKDARTSVVEAANEAYMNAPQGRDHAEKLTLDMVTQLVADLAKTEAKIIPNTL